jgi:predicted permease
VAQTSAQQLARLGSPDVVHVESAATGLSELRTRYERALYALTGFGALLWALACVNVSGVFLIRTIARETELKIHAALGASRARLIGRIATEAALLIAIAGFLAFGAMRTIGAYLIRTAWTSVSSSTIAIAPDRLALFTLLAGCAVTAFVVVVPSLVVVLMRDWVSLVASARDTPRRATAWWRRAIVTAQVAASLVLVAVAILLVQNLWRLRALPTGVAQDQIAFARLEPRPGLKPLADASDVLRDMLDRAAALPGSTGGAFAVSFPTSELRQIQSTAPGYRAERAPAGSEVAAAVDWISPGFFHAVGMRLLGGRDLTWDDVPGHPEVAVISARMAQRVFAATDPIGQRVRLPSGKLLTVVGVVSDAAGGDPRVEDFPRMYLPVLQDPRRIDNGNLIVRHGGALDVRAGIQVVVNAIGRQSILYVRTANEQTSLVLGRERLLAQVSSYFAVLAVLVVVIGLYGVLAYAVAQRRRELAIRAALGAQRLKLLTTVIGETAWMTIAGIAVGVPTALWARRAVHALLFNGANESAAALAMATGIMVVAAIIATLAPSRQLLKPALIDALRQD